MPSASFVQTDFRGGIWSPTAQGRTTLEEYKTALNVCLNAMPLEQGAWTRRPGFRYIGMTRYGLPAVLRPFRYSRTQAYQAELTALKLRFVAGLTHLLEEDTEAKVMSISLDTPAKVHVSDMTGWANGDVVMFEEPAVPAEPSSYYLAGRQFKIASVDNTANTFTLLDPFSGASINGATIDWKLRPVLTTVKRVLEFTTPWPEADLSYVRVVTALGATSNEDVTLFLCKPPGSLGYKPYALKQNGDTQFTFAIADFVDGPYFDENETTTTLGISDITGSVTVTASSTAGINDGDGFKTTDVGRHIWWQGGPAEWDNSVPYNKGQVALGSDNNIYKSLIKNNLNFDPTTDDGSRWEITAQQVQITWLKITGWTSTTVVTATVMNDNLDSSAGNPCVSTNAPTTHWRLGLYSDTTGYPSCGTYHEGRLVLAGAVPNRGDGSRTFKPLEFSPTYEDGTVADDSAIAFTLNNKDAELVSWMLSVDEGLEIATLAGEWFLGGAEAEDALTPTSQRARNVTSYGSAFVEPVYTYGAPIFVQAAGQKVMTHRRNNIGRYEAINHSEKAEGIMSPGIDEIAWAQEPLLSLFCRKTDGTLIGCTHRMSNISEPFTGWHQHEHGYERTFEAISGGPNFTGSGDSLFVVTAAAEDPDDSPRWIETMMPQPSSGQGSWRYWHLDSSSVGWFIRRMIVANGDSFDGLRIYGLHHLAGETVHPYIGGLDLGDFTVTANGTIDLPYSGSFTAAFLDGLDDGTDYEDWGMYLRWYDTAITDEPVHPENTIGVIEVTTGSYPPSGGFLIMDMPNDVAYLLDRDYLGGSDGSIRVFDALAFTLLREITGDDTIFDEVATAKELKVNSFFPGVGGRLWAFARADANAADGFLVGYSWSSGQDCKMAIIDATTMIQVAETDFTELIKNIVTFSYQSDLGEVAQVAFTTHQLDSNSFCKVKLVNLTDNGPLMNGVTPYAQGAIMFTDNLNAGFDEELIGCRGWERPDLSVFFTLGHNGSATTGWTDATSLRIREWMLECPILTVNFTNRVIRDLLVTDFDSGWAAVRDVAIVYCEVDNSLLVFAREDSGGTDESRILKLDAASGTTIWNSLMPHYTGQFPSQDQGPFDRGRWSYMHTDSTVHTINLDDGTWSSPSTVQTGFTSLGDIQWYDEIGPSIIMNGQYSENAGETAFYLGAWAIAEEPSWNTDVWNRIWLGDDWEQSQDNRDINATYWFVPAQFGMSFTSRGQLLRPDYGQDAGTRNGPAFGKTRRSHEYAINLYRSFNVKIGTDFDKLYSVPLKTAGGTPYSAPTLFSGIVSDTLRDDFSYDGMIAWEVTRQYPCTVTSVGGYIVSADK